MKTITFLFALTLSISAFAGDDLDYILPEVATPAINVASMDLSPSIDGIDTSISKTSSVDNDRNDHAWTTTQYVGEGLIAALYFIDDKQTTEAQSNRRLYETNKMLGKYPSHSAINKYFVSAYTLQVTAAYFLPTKYRTVLLSAIIGIELQATIHNRQLGVKFKF